MSLYQFLSLFLQVLMHVPSDLIFCARTKQSQELSANAECLVYRAQQHANAMTLAISVTTVEE